MPSPSSTFSGSDIAAACCGLRDAFRASGTVFKKRTMACETDLNRASHRSPSSTPQTAVPTHSSETGRQSGAQVYALLDKARVTIARQEALAAEEADLCERSDFLNSSR